MFKKAFKRLTGAAKEPSSKKPAPSKPVASEKPKAKVLTAEGWKRLMMKKYRK